MDPEEEEAGYPWWLAAVGAALGAIGATLFFVVTQRVGPVPIVIEPAPPTVAPLPTATPGPTATALPVAVYVSGAVAAPAVYELPAGSRVDAAIAAAGGFSESAFEAAINLALPLSDGMQLHVPTLETPVPLPVVAVAPLPATDAAGEANGGGLINLNTADAAALERLPGIGPSTAQSIIAYREENGPFVTVEDILNVTGIGPAKLAQIADKVTVGP